MSSTHLARACVIGALIAVTAYAGWSAAAYGQERTPPTNAPSAPVTSPPAAPTPASPTPAKAPRPAQHVHDSADVLRCGACHATLPDGRLRTRFPDRRLKPQSAWLGMAHDRDWTVRHRWIAADPGSQCAQCHKERDCVDCHDGRERPRAIHPNDWLTLHPQHARRSATDCQGCHSLQTFCTECHARLGISQMSAPEVRTGARVHPPASQWTGALNQHGREALRSLSTCVSCHAEQDCVGCHAAGTPSGARSPHPVGFRDRCGALLRANPRACAACHSADLNGLRLACP